MAPENLTRGTEFIPMGVSIHPELQIPHFGIFLVIYALTLRGNLVIITRTRADSQLQTPMYFFLWHLAVINLGNSIVIAPKILVNVLDTKKTISYYGCVAQVGGFLVFIMLRVSCGAMACDCYVVICTPLLYLVVVSPQICLLLVSLFHLYSLFCVFSVWYGSSNVINHFYCDNVPLLVLSCSDTYIPETEVFTFSGTNFCASHLLAVTVFYGTLFFMYLKPRTNHSLDTDKMASVFYTLVIPMLNPLIYSLRNKDVKEALKRFLDNP
uniref:G-protein coupled receptors family 1 profile domain-containing protein n=1 Tax=Sus scrofa TaxID=9823 RepID=A0A8D1XMP9_PIG